MFLQNGTVVMSSDGNEYSAWGTCLDCGYQGLLTYGEVHGERYGGEEDLAVVMLLRCPACESEDHTLVPTDYYRELVAGNGSEE